MKKDIILNGKKYFVKYRCFGAAYKFEEETGKSYTEAKTLKDQHLFVYFILDTLNDDFNLTFEEFVEYIEDNPNEEQALWIALEATLPKK